MRQHSPYRRPLPERFEHRGYLSPLVLISALAVRGVLAAEGGTDDLLAEIESIGSTDWTKSASPGSRADAQRWQSLAARIEANPEPICRALLPRLGDEDRKESLVALYVWAVGRTKDSKAVAGIIGAYKKRDSELIHEQCLKALAGIGGREAGAFLLLVLDETKDPERRFDLMNLLAETQCEDALPRMEELLRVEKSLYWQPIFVFGKMGDKAVPLLIKKIEDKDTEVRANALQLLGKWLIPTEAVPALRKRFWGEKDPKLRVMILGVLEVAEADLSATRSFFETVAAKEKDAEVLKFAQETLSALDKHAADMASVVAARQPSPEAFQAEWDKLHRSAGKEGDYKALGAASCRADEPKLKQLRERVLLRDSDESFYDYQKINRIILENRWGAKAGAKAETKAGPKSGSKAKAAAKPKPAG